MGKRFGDLQVVSHFALKGMKHGIRIDGKSRIYVAPEIYSLLQTDFEAMVKSLKILLLPKGSLIDESVFKNPHGGEPWPHKTTSKS